MTAIFCWYFIDTVMVQRTRSGRQSLLLILQSYIAKWTSVYLSLVVVTVFALKADAASESTAHFASGITCCWEFIHYQCNLHEKY